MNIKLTISSSDHSQTFKKDFSSEQEWKSSEIYSRLENTRVSNTYYPWSAIFIPVRTNSIRNFSKDLFLPNSIYLCDRVNKFGLKALALFGAFLLDAITMPIRLITALPWKLLAPKKEESELYKFLIKEGVNKEVLKGDYIKVEAREDKLLARNLFGTNPCEKNVPLIPISLLQLYHPSLL